MEKSPLALYLLALFRETLPNLAPWGAQDDPDDLFRVVLSCPTRTISVRVSPKMSRVLTHVEASPDGEWVERVQKVVDRFLNDALSVGSHQVSWKRREARASVTPLPADDREP